MRTSENLTFCRILSLKSLRSQGPGGFLSPLRVAFFRSSVVPFDRPSAPIRAERESCTGVNRSVSTRIFPISVISAPNTTVEDPATGSLERSGWDGWFSVPARRSGPAQALRSGLPEVGKSGPRRVSPGGDQRVVGSPGAGELRRSSSSPRARPSRCSGCWPGPSRIR